uniref:Capsid protein n=1 Tax=Lanius cristatus parvoviridae sp. TaxID=2794482 RepID=A0A8E7L5M5_9VIRU|nr:MAG: capsid protein [Lanius cristatus parvoviridae sp.]
MPHWPGYRYCGPGTDIKQSDRQGGPINELDQCCRQHDFELSAESPIDQRTADQRFKSCAGKEGYLGQAFASAIGFRQYLDTLPAINAVLPGQKMSNQGIKRHYPISKQLGRGRPLKKSDTNFEKDEGEGTGEGESGMETGVGLEQQSGSGTGGVGGGGQIPPMNLRPIQTGTQIFHFSRIFRHYVMTGTPDYKSVFNQQWSDIPYQHMVMSMKPRDWQIINTVSKRWRVLSAGFNMNHIIPFVNGEKSVGGAVTGDIAFNMFPYLESYIDKGYQLPQATLYADKELPNNGGTQNSGNQESAKLHQIDVAMTTQSVFNPTNSTQPDLALQATAGSKCPVMDLMNSTEWGTIQPSQEFSFEWSPIPDDLKWRHAIMPDTISNIPSVAYQMADPFGRVDGGINVGNTTNTSGPNTTVHNFLKDNPSKPAPSCLVRPVTIHNDQGQLLPIVFQVLIKYHITIECDVNDIGFRPILTRRFAEGETPTWTQDMAYHMYQDKAAAQKQQVHFQWSGANANGNFATGPSHTGYIV